MNIIEVITRGKGLMNPPPASGPQGVVCGVVPVHGPVTLISLLSVHDAGEQPEGL